MAKNKDGFEGGEIMTAKDLAQFKQKRREAENKAAGRKRPSANQPESAE